MVLQADLAEPAACRGLVEAAAEALGGLSAVVLAASRFDRLAFDAWTPPPGIAPWPSTSTRRSTAPRPPIPHLRRAGGGHIVLFSDWVAASGRPRYRGYLPYYVAKRGVVALGEALGLELAPDGIRVHVDRPRADRAGGGEHAARSRQGPGRHAARALGRRGRGRPASGVGLLASTFITGETIRVDGGRHLA